MVDGDHVSILYCSSGPIRAYAVSGMILVYAQLYDILYVVAIWVVELLIQVYHSWLGYVNVGLIRQLIVASVRVKFLIYIYPSHCLALILNNAHHSL